MSIEEIVKEEEEALKRMEEAKRKADDILVKARDEARRILTSAIRQERVDALLRKEEEEAKKRAEEILEEFKAKAEALKKLPDGRFEEAVDFVFEEVLRFE